MSDAQFTLLENRRLIRLEGEDTRSFLQGLISNDVDKVTMEQAIYAAFLTPQGKYLFDFFVFVMDGAFWLDCEAARAEEFRTRLSRYRLRSKVTIEDGGTGYSIAAVFGGSAPAKLGLSDIAGHTAKFDGGVAFTDPRLAKAGARAVLPADAAGKALTGAGLTETPFDVYDAHRIGLGLPDGSRDMVVEKTILLEAGFEELNGVDWDKGCYLGQELTARTHYRGLVKRRIVPVAIDGASPAPGTPILRDGKEVGEVRSSVPGAGIAMMRLEHLAEGGGDFTAGEARLTPRKPEWAAF